MCFLVHAQTGHNEDLRNISIVSNKGVTVSRDLKKGWALTLPQL